MINLGPNAEAAAPAVPVTSVKIFGVGGAGLALIARLADMRLGPADVVAAGTDASALMNSPAGRKIQLGREGTKGLGAGGDMALGEGATRESVAEIRAECADAQVVIVCAGLGGGTGSGAAPVIAQEAHRTGALVIGVVTMPLAGEGGKRREQASQALHRLAGSCTAILCFENDRLNELGPEGVTISEALDASIRTLAGAVAAVVRMVSLPAVLRLGVDELARVFRDSGVRCEFGCGFASGSGRAEEAVKEALHSPLLEKGRLLSSAENVLVHVTGGHSLKLAEVHSILRHVSNSTEENAQIMLGVALDSEDDDTLGVVIMASGSTEAAPPKDGDEAGGEQGAGGDGEGVADDKVPSVRGRTKGGRKPAAGEQQGELLLDQAMRGRFKDMDPTMVEGQDLDIPSFIRLQVRLE